MKFSDKKSISEQNSISTNADKPMTLCDQLETLLITTQTETKKLMKSILYEVLTLRSEPKQSMVL